MTAPRKEFYRSQEVSTLVLYDLRDPEVWKRASRERRAWGRLRTMIHPLDTDHVVIEFKPGGAMERTS